MLHWPCSEQCKPCSQTVQLSTKQRCEQVTVDVMITCTDDASKLLSTIVISQCTLRYGQHMESCEVADLSLCLQEP